MKTIILYDIFIILWTMIDDFRNYHEISAAIEVNKLERKNWHTAQFLATFFMIFFLSIFPAICIDENFPIELVFLQLSGIWVIIHNIGISYLLYKDIFYIGTSTKADKLVRKVLKNNAKLFWIYPAFLVILISLLTVFICLKYSG